MIPTPDKPKGKLAAFAAQPGRVAERDLLRRAIQGAGAHALEVLVVGGGAEPAAPAAWEGLGAAQVRVSHVRSREDAERDDLVARVHDADAVLLTGAHALRITNLLGGSPLLAALARAYARGALVLATGAGAPAVSATMVLRADEGGESVLITPGLGLLPNAVVDTHFAARGRVQRVFEVVTRHPGHVALGLGEGSAILVQDGGSVEAAGTGSVLVVDGHDLGHSNLPTRQRGCPVAMERLVVHVLVEGYRYDLGELRYLPPQPVSCDAQPEGAAALA